MSSLFVYAALLVAVTTLLAGCGGAGGGDGGGGGGGGNVIVDCGREQLRAHCDGMCLQDPSNHITCTACKPPYKFDSATKSCQVNCSDLPPPARKPALPSSARDLDGVAWPDACFDEGDDVNFFAIGDWGGVCSWPNVHSQDPTRNLCQDPVGWRPAGVIPGKTFPMDTYKRTTYVDENGQTLVADKMMHMYKDLLDKGSPPRFVLNAGDSFYPGSIEDHCSNRNGHDLDKIVKQYQFKAVFEDMYTSDEQGFNEMEWWGVLGNHDYGGNCYIKAWDQIIFYTWKPNGRWVIPAPYWRRHVQFKRFDADFFFIDTNVIDAEPPDVNPRQNICFRDGNTGVDNPQNHCRFEDYPADRGAGESCPATNGPQNPDDCFRWFQNLWTKAKAWLDQGLEESTADWQIVVQHHPAKYSPGGLDWADYSEKHGIDLIVTGHQHFQKLYYNSPIEDQPSMNLGPTTHIIVGGGGGIQTDLAPNPDGNDDSYGYAVVKLSLDKLEVSAYTHGGKLGPEQVLRNRTIARYRERGQASVVDQVVI